MIGSEKGKQFYNYVKEQGITVPESYDDFAGKMQDSEVATQFYNHVKERGITVPKNASDFQSVFLAEKKSPSQTGSEDSGVGSEVSRHEQTDTLSVDSEALQQSREALQDPVQDFDFAGAYGDKPVPKIGFGEDAVSPATARIQAEEKKQAEKKRLKAIAETPLPIIEEYAANAEMRASELMHEADSAFRVLEEKKLILDNLNNLLNLTPEEARLYEVTKQEYDQLSEQAPLLKAEADMAALKRDAAMADRHIKRSQKGSVAGAMQNSIIESTVDMGAQALRMVGYIRTLGSGEGQEAYMQMLDEGLTEKADKLKYGAKLISRTPGVPGSIPTEETTPEFIAANTQEMGLKSGLITVAQSAPMLAGSYVTMFLGMASEADKMLKEAPGAENMSIHEKMGYQAIYGTVGALLEKAGLQAVLGVGAGGKVATNITNRIIKSVVGKGEKLTLNNVQRAALNLTKGATAEGLTEVGQESLSIGMEEVTNLLKDETVFNPNEWQDVWDRNTHAFKMGLNAGLLMTSPVAVVTSGRKLAVERSPKMLQGVTETDYKNAEAAMTPDGRDDVIQFIDAQVQSGNLDAETAEEWKGSVDEFIEINGKMKDGMTTEQKMKAFPLLQRKQALQETIKNTDESFLTDEKEQVEQINQELGAIVGNKTTEETVTQPEAEEAPVEATEETATEQSETSDRRTQITPEPEAKAGDYFTREIDGETIVYQQTEGGVARMLPPEESEQVLQSQEQVETEQVDQVESGEQADLSEEVEAPVETVQPTPATTKKVKSGKTEFSVDMDADGNVLSVKTQKGKTVNPTTKSGKSNAQYNKAVALATGQMTDHQIKQERERKFREATNDEYVIYDPHTVAMTYLANGAELNPESVRSETGMKSENLKWVTNFKPEADLPSVEQLAESIWEDISDKGSRFTDMEIRDALIDILTTYENRESIKDALIENYEKQVDQYYGMTDEQLLDMEIASMPEGMRALYEVAQAESDLSPEEKQQYYEREYEKHFDSLSPEEQAAFYDSYGEADQTGSTEEGSVQEVSSAEEVETFESAFTKGLDIADSFLDDLSRQLDQFSQENLGVGLPVAVAKMAVNAARVAVKTAKNASQVIDAAIQAVIDSDWYKGLSEQEKKQAESDTRDLFRKPAQKEPKKESPKPKPEQQKVESNTGEPLEQPKGTVNTQENPTKETQELGSPESYQKTVDKSYDEAEKKLSGIKNDLVPEDKQGTYNKEKRSVQETLDRGKALVDSGVINPRQFVEELNEKQRALQSDEIAALVYYKAMLDGQNDALYDQIERAKETGNGELQSQAEMALAEVEAQIEAYHEMSEKTGYEQGHTLRMRQLLLTREYALVNQVRKFKRQTGKNTVPPEVLARFEMYEKNLKELDKRVKELESEQEKAAEKLEILKDEKKPKSKKAPSGLTEAEKKRRIELRKKFLNRLNDITAIAQLLADKEFYEYAGLVFKEAKGEFNEFARKMIREVGKGIKDHLPKLYKDLGGTGSTKFDIKQPELKDGQLYIPDEFVIDLIKSGFDTIETASKEALRIIKEVEGMKDVTERQVRDAISDYGKRSKLSKDEIMIRLSEMKSIGKMLSALEDVKRKKRPKRSGKERRNLTDRERKLRRQINELLKEIPQTDSEIESAWKSALDGVKQRMKNRIADLNEQIKTGERTQKKRTIKLDAEAQLLKEEVERLTAILRSIEGKPELSFEQKVQIAENALEKSIQEYQRRIKEKDFTPIQKEPVSTPKIKKLREQQKSLREQYQKLREESPEGKKRRDDAALKRIAREIRKVEGQIEGRIAVESKKQASKEYGAHVEAAKKRLESLREQLKETEQYKEVAEKKKLETVKKNARRAIERYQERIKNNDYAVKKPAEAKLDEEAKRLKIDQQRWKNKFDLEREKQVQADRDRWEKISDGVVDVFTTPKALLATADLSAPLRQGAILSARRPKSALKAGKEMFGQAFSEQKYEQWMDELVFSEEYVLAKRAGLYLSLPNAKLLAKEEQFVSNLAERIPGYGRIVRGSNRAYSAYLNYMRMDSFVAFAKNLDNLGLTEDQKARELKAFAKFVNNASGRGNIGKWEPTDKALSILFFAPKYVVSRLNIIGNSLTFFAMYPKHARKEALKTVGSYYSIYILIASLMAAAGADVEDDPRSSDFGKIRFGKLRFDLGAGLLQPIRVLAQILSQQKKSIKTGEIIELNQDGWGRQTTADIGKTFLRGKLSPTPGAVVDFMAAPKDKTKEYELFGQNLEGRIYFQNLIGDESTIPEKAIEMVAPLFVSDMKEVYSEEGAPTAAAAVLPALFGVGVQYYGDGSEKESSNTSSPTTLPAPQPLR